MSEVAGHRIEAIFGVKGSWVMTLHPDGMVLAPARGRGTEYEVATNEIADIVTLKDPAVGGPCLIVNSEKRMGFRLGRRAAAAYAEWRGPLSVGDLGKALKVATVWAIPVGILFVVTSLPFPGDEPLPLDPVGLVLGGGLLLIGILGRLVKTRWLFVLDALWWVGLATKTTLGVLDGASPAWLVLTAVAILFCFAQIQWFRRFPPDRELAGPAPQDAEDTDVL